MWISNAGMAIDLLSVHAWCKRMACVLKAVEILSVGCNNCYTCRSAIQMISTHVIARTDRENSISADAFKKAGLLLLKNNVHMCHIICDVSIFLWQFFCTSFHVYEAWLCYSYRITLQSSTIYARPNCDTAKLIGLVHSVLCSNFQQVCLKLYCSALAIRELGRCRTEHRCRVAIILTSMQVRKYTNADHWILLVTTFCTLWILLHRRLVALRWVALHSSVILIVLLVLLNLHKSIRIHNNCYHTPGVIFFDKSVKERFLVGAFFLYKLNICTG